MSVNSDAGSPDYDAKGWIAREQYAESKLPSVLMDTNINHSLGYSVSKIGVSRLAGLQAKVALTDPRPGILVNAVSMSHGFHCLVFTCVQCCPGWVRTDMGGDSATRSVEEGWSVLLCSLLGPHTHTLLHTGADTPVYLALLPPGVTEPNGQLVYSRKVVSFM